MTIRTLMNSAGLNSVNLCISLYPWFLHSMWIHVFFFLLLRNTLCTEEVLTFINTRMLFWACSTSRPEGYRGNCHTGDFLSVLHSAHLSINFLFLIGDRFKNSLTNLLTMVCWWLSSVSQALRENTYPFLAMIMLKDRKMTVVGRLEGLIQPEDLINQLNFIMEANQTYLTSERLER